jgi:hypothetical protein
VEVLGNRELVSWNFDTFPSGYNTIKVYCKVVASNLTFINEASVILEEVNAVKSNKTYHEVGSLPLNVSKSARLTSTGIQSNGTEAAPVDVNINDIVEYTLNVLNDNKEVIEKQQYDIVFALDWSGSMGGVRDKSRDLVLQMSQKVFENYPGSRVAVMGMNCTENIQYVPQYTVLQIDTPFVGPADYATTIANAYALTPLYAQDDCPMFISAATDKLSGDTSITYGTDTSYPRKAIPRTDFARTPVIVMISDWISTAQEAVLSSLNRYHEALPDGIFIGVNYNRSYGAATQTTEAINSYKAVSPDKWAWVELNYSLTAQEGFNRVWAAFDTYVPSAPPAIIGDVSDLLPAGMAYVNSTPTASSATVDPTTGRTRVTWSAASLAQGMTTFKIQARVNKTRASLTDYMNTASVTVAGEGAVYTNSTYHRMENSMILHLRQIVVNPDGSYVELPAVGYYTMENNGESIGLASSSGLEGAGITGYTKYVLPNNADPLYAIDPLIPAGYTYWGYNATPTNAAHSSLSRSVGDVTLDYTDNFEQWLTVYLRRVKVETPFVKESKTNDFGFMAKLH